MTLTGKMRYRTNWRGQIILQVQYAYLCLPDGARPRADGSNIVTRYEWRDAKVSDVFGLGISAAPREGTA